MSEFSVGICTISRVGNIDCMKMFPAEVSANNEVEAISTAFDRLHAVAVTDIISIETRRLD